MTPLAAAWSMSLALKLVCSFSFPASLVLMAASKALCCSLRPLETFRFLVRRSDHRSSIFREHKVEKIDVTDGIVVVTKDVQSKTPVKPEKNADPTKDAEPQNDAAEKEIEKLVGSSPF